MSGCWGGEVNGKRGFVVWMGHGLRGRRIFLVVGIMGKRLEKQTNFSMQFHFISFRYVRPCPVGLFYFGVFILY